MERLLGHVLADDLRVEIVLDYVSESGRATRTVTIDTLYGPQWECPTHVRGRCSRAGERRAFRLDRVVAVHLPNGSFTDNIPWRIGHFIAGLTGRMVERAEQVWSFQRHVKMGVRDDDGVTDFDAHLGPAWLEHTPQGWRIRLEVRGRPIPAGRTRQFRLFMGPAGYGRQPTYITDVVTGESISEVIEWMDRIAGPVTEP